MLGKKSSEKSAKHRLLYSHENRGQKKGEKTRETIFPETHEEWTHNVWKKIVGKKCEATFFYIHTNIVTKKWVGKKCANLFFQKHTNSARKNVGKKIVGKKCEKRFLYSHE